VKNALGANTLSGDSKHVLIDLIALRAIHPKTNNLGCF
jgi:hypothetical protein